MKSRGLIITILLLTFSTSAHVGSPNVFFDGRAGDHEVSVVIRPPAALPGMAQISVRVSDPMIRSVTLLPVLWQSGRKGSPSPIVAERVAGESNLWSGEVWLLRPGSYQIEITVDDETSGTARVPVTVLGLEAQAMSSGMKFGLLLLGFVLVVGAILIARAIARDGVMLPGVVPGRIERLRGVLTATIFGFALFAGVTAGAVRWKKMDDDYRANGLHKPQPVGATVQIEGERITLELRQPDDSPPGFSWAGLVPEHGKLMHLFMVREPDLNVFVHLHPVRINAQAFKAELPALPGGEYQLYGDITFENGISQTLLAKTKVPEPLAPIRLAPAITGNLSDEAFCGSSTATNQFSGRDMDDSWHVEMKDLANLDARSLEPNEWVSPLMGKFVMRFKNGADVAANRGGILRFAVYDSAGEPAQLQNYMGMLGHAAVRRRDGSVFAHLHPSGSFSMASEEVFRRVDGELQPDQKSSETKASTNQVSFPYEFPKPGEYRLWIQVRAGGRLLTGQFDLTVN